jgi:1-acyl-sn-glycerol-3-phosphate acyltransferase
MPTAPWPFALRAWTALVVSAPIAWLGMVLLPTLRLRWAAMRFACRLALRLAGIGVTVEGAKHWPRPPRPCIIVSNHTSFLDVVLLGALLPEPVRYVAKAELGRRFTTRLPLTRIGTLFVERFERRRALADYRHIVAVAAKGPPLLFFAEGTLRAEPGLLPFHVGAFLAAAETGLPIVPVAIRGLRAILPGDSRWPRPGSATLAILPPVIAAAEGLHRGEAAERLRQETRARILAACGEPEIGEPPARARSA